MALTKLGAIQLLRRDPVHRVPGCWYVQDSRMLHDLDERTTAAMARLSTTATYAAGELLHEAGEPMEAVTFVSRGRVKVYRLSREGKQETIAMLGPGDAFGEIGVVDRAIFAAAPRRRTTPASKSIADTCRPGLTQRCR